MASVSNKGLRQFKRARTRALNAEELGAYITRVEALSDSVAREVLEVRVKGRHPSPA